MRENGWLISIESADTSNQIFEGRSPMVSTTNVLILKLRLRYAAYLALHDPVELATKMLSRLPGKRGWSAIASHLEQSQKNSVLLAWAWYLAGDYQHSRCMLDRSGAIDSFSKKGLSRMVYRQVDKSARLIEAKARWEVGDIDGAIELVPDCHLPVARWRSQRSILEGRVSPKIGSGASKDRTLDEVRNFCGSQVGAFRVLHWLNNSLPATQSGYTLRTQGILLAQKASGIDLVPITKKVSASNRSRATSMVSSVDEITYFHPAKPLESLLPATRLNEQAEWLHEVCRICEPDILHTTTNYENALVTKAVSEISGIPWVYECRGELEKTWLSRQSERNSEAAKNSQMYKLMRDIETSLMRSADAVIVLSEAQRRSAVIRGVKSSNLIVVPNSVSSDVLDQPIRNSLDVRRGLGIPDRFTVGSVSSIVSYEGIDILLRAVRVAVDAGADVQVLIVGDGPELSALRSLGESLNLEDRLQTPGRQPQENIIEWFDAIDVFCVPRRDLDVTRSVTPLKPLQAMARRKPILVSNLPPLDELVVGRGAGFSFEPGSFVELARMIELLYADPITYQSLADSARAAAELLTWENAAKKYKTLYQDIATRKRRGASVG